MHARFTSSPIVRRTSLAGCALLIFALLIPATRAETDADGSLDLIVQLIAEQQDAPFQLDLLRGMRQGLEGRRDVKPPAGWSQLYERLSGQAEPEMQRLLDELGVIFGDRQVIERLIERLADSKLPVEERQSALEAVGGRAGDELLPALLQLLGEPALRGAAIRHLARLDDPQVAERLLAVYADMSEAERDEAVLALAAREAYALALLEAIARGDVPRRDVSAFALRQMSQLGPAVSSKLAEVWGSVRSSTREKLEQLEKYRALLVDASGEPPDARRGRLVFQRTCQKCHQLFGEGEQIGPDLTGTNRANVDYLLENMIDPSSMIGKDYQLWQVELEDGRLLSGLVVGEDARSVRLRTTTELVVLPRESIEWMETSSVSMMPEGQLDELTPQEVRDLVSYLQSPSQVE